jgi:hypothetical protein
MSKHTSIDTPNGHVDEDMFILLTKRLADSEGLLAGDRDVFREWRREWRAGLAAVEADIRANRPLRRQANDRLRWKADEDARGLRYQAWVFLATLHVLRAHLAALPKGEQAAA